MKISKWGGDSGTILHVAPRNSSFSLLLDLIFGLRLAVRGGCQISGREGDPTWFSGDEIEALTGNRVLCGFLEQQEPE